MAINTHQMREQTIVYAKTVLKAIANAKNTNATHLDLSYLSVGDIPPSLGELTQLTSLNLAGNNFFESSIPGSIWKLTNLKHLNLSNSYITAVTSAIENLPNLESLNLSGNFIPRLPAEISRLEKLQSLMLSNIGLREIPPEVFTLHNLKALNISNNRISFLSKKIESLSNLRELYLTNVGLEKLPEEISELSQLNTLSLANNKLGNSLDSIWELKNLILLALSGNHISNLSHEIGKLKFLQHLYLTDNDLLELPYTLGELTNLTTLSVSYNQLQELPSEIGKLRNLRELHARNNQITQLPLGLENLTKLEYLWMSDNQVQDIDFNIGQWNNLIEMNLSNNRLVSIPSAVSGLSKLVRLYLSNNKIKALPTELGQIYELEQFAISGNMLEALCPEIGTLKRLKWLDISHNKISKLPKEIERLAPTLSWLCASNNQLTEPIELVKLPKLFFLNLRDNPLPIPPEILKDPFHTAGFLRTFYSENRQPLLEAKLIFVGQGSVGKTSLVRRLILLPFINNESKTEGIAISKWKLDQTKINLNIWDFGGQEIMHATHQFFLTKRSLYVLVLDVRLTEEENRVEYWLKIIQSFGGESPVLIVGNKIDQHPLDIDRTGLQKKYPNIVGILETSAATGAGIETLKIAITEQVNNLPHVRDLLPETWFTVKTKLEGLGRESNFITHDKYLDLCAENEVSDEISQHTLIGFLHDLGVVLHFQDDPRLEALGILNPQWVTNGVYKILNSHTLFQNKGVLTVAMLDEILNLPEYPRGKRLFIVDMMKKFELCYDLESDKSFLVPDLLPKDQPDLKFNGIPAFEYAYPVLPSSIITRFIVRMNQKIDDALVWRTGVVLKIGSNIALVKADIEDKKITIAIDGLEHTRRDALSAIRYQLDEIHASIKGLNPQKMVPIPNAPKAEALDYDYLLQLERDGDLEVLPVKDGNRLVKVNIRQLLSGVESEAQRKQAGDINVYVGNDFKGNLTIGDANTATAGSK